MRWKFSSRLCRGCAPRWRQHTVLEREVDPPLHPGSSAFRTHRAARSRKMSMRNQGAEKFSGRILKIRLRRSTAMTRDQRAVSHRQCHFDLLFVSPAVLAGGMCRSENTPLMRCQEIIYAWTLISWLPPRPRLMRFIPWGRWDSACPDRNEPDSGTALAPGLQYGCGDIFRERAAGTTAEAGSGDLEPGGRRVRAAMASSDGAAAGVDGYAGVRPPR